MPPQPPKNKEKKEVGMVLPSIREREGGAVCSRPFSRKREDEKN